MTPSPNIRHQWVLQNLDTSLGVYVRKENVGEVWVAPLDVRLRDDTAVQPDLIYVSNARAVIIQENFIAGAPDLAVESLPPSTAAHDRATKLRLYAEAGVPAVWYIDPKARTVEVLKLEVKKYFVDTALAGDEVLTSATFPGWELPLEKLFDFRGRF